MANIDNQSEESEAKVKFFEIVNNIREDEKRIQMHRDNEYFNQTKYEFLKRGRSEKEHKLWRARGIHGDMFKHLNYEFNHLNSRFHVDVENFDQLLSVCSDNDQINYPYILQSHLERHAAVYHAVELNATNVNMESTKNHTIGSGLVKYADAELNLEGEQLTLEQMVKILHKRSPHETIKKIHEKLLCQCRRRRKMLIDDNLTLPLRLYANSNIFEGYALVYVPPKKSEFLFRKIK